MPRDFYRVETERFVNAANADQNIERIVVHKKSSKAFRFERLEPNRNFCYIKVTVGVNHRSPEKVEVATLEA